MPGDKEENVVEVAKPDTVLVRDPGLEVTMYPVMALPPVSLGAVQDTDIVAFPTSSAKTLVGAEGAVYTALAADGLEGALISVSEFAAVTVNV